MTARILWIDDLRPAPVGAHWAKTSVEAIEVLSSGVAFDHISFDHDLGGDDTSRAVVLWLCENGNAWPKTASVHSMNPVGVQWLTGMLERYFPGKVIRGIPA